MVKDRDGVGLWDGGVIIVWDKWGWFGIVWFGIVQYKWGWFWIGGDGRDMDGVGLWDGGVKYALR